MERLSLCLMITVKKEKAEADPVAKERKYSDGFREGGRTTAIAVISVPSRTRLSVLLKALDAAMLRNGHALRSTNGSHEKTSLQPLRYRHDRAVQPCQKSRSRSQPATVGHMDVSIALYPFFPYRQKVCDGQFAEIATVGYHLSSVRITLVQETVEKHPEWNLASSAIVYFLKNV